MDLKHQFTVPVPVGEAWAHFNDIESVAQCFPGATVTSADEQGFKGSVKVKLGPIALLYNGSGEFVEKDDVAHRFVVEAKGKDKRGNGTAGATVTLTMTEAGGSTDVEVLTDLSVTGKPAQFGRGVMQDVSDKLLGQFVSCLEDRFTASGTDAAEVDDQDAEPASQPTGAAAAPDSPGDQDAEPASAPAPGPAPVTSVRSGPGSAGQQPSSGGDALDLGATVLPVLLKSYWKQGLGVLLVLLVLRRLLRRK